MNPQVTDGAAELAHVGLLEVSGPDARSFLHAQLTNDVAGLPPDQTRYAGWCSPKGRLLASLLLIPRGDGFLLQLARDIAPAVARRLAMFVLRAKVTVADVSAVWAQFGLWGQGAEQRLATLGVATPGRALEACSNASTIAIRIAAQRFLVVAPASQRTQLEAALCTGSEQAWQLEEIRLGRALVSAATQDLFLPQMLDFERLGALDFTKGCYPGQEVVARTQYRGQLKRRLVRARLGIPVSPGAELYSDGQPSEPSGTVVTSAVTAGGGSEFLAVVQVAALEQDVPIRLSSRSGEALEILTLPSPA